MSTQSTSSNRSRNPGPPSPTIASTPAPAPTRTASSSDTTTASNSAGSTSWSSNKGRPASYASAAATAIQRTGSAGGGGDQDSSGGTNNNNNKSTRGKGRGSSGGGSRKGGGANNNKQQQPKQPSQTESSSDNAQDTANDDDPVSPPASNLQLGAVLASLPAAQSRNSFEVLQTFQGDNYTTPPPSVPLTPTLSEAPIALAISEEGDNDTDTSSGTGAAGRGVGAGGGARARAGAGATDGKPRLIRQQSYGQVRVMEEDVDNVFVKLIPDSFTCAMVQKHFTINDVVPDLFEHRPAFPGGKRNIELYYRDATLAAEAIRRFHKSKLDDRNLIYVMYLSHRLDPTSGTRCAPKHDRAGTPSNSVARALGPAAPAAPAPGAGAAATPTPTPTPTPTSAAAAAGTSDLASMTSLASATSDSVSDRAASPAGLPARPGSLRGSAMGGGAATGSGAGTSPRSMGPVAGESVPAGSLAGSSSMATGEHQEKPKLDVEYVVDLYNIPYLCPISALPPLLLPHAIIPYDVRKCYMGHPSSPAVQARISAMTPRQARSEHGGRVRLVFATLHEAQQAVDKLQAGEVHIEARELHGRMFGVWRKGMGMERIWPAAPPAVEAAPMAAAEQGKVEEGASESVDRYKDEAKEVGETSVSKADEVTMVDKPAVGDEEVVKAESKFIASAPDSKEQVEATRASASEAPKDEPTFSATVSSPPSNKTAGPHGVFIDNTTQLPGASTGTVSPNLPTISGPEALARDDNPDPTPHSHDDDGHPHVHYADTVRDPEPSHIPHDKASHDGDVSTNADGDKPAHIRSSMLPPNTFATAPIHVHPPQQPAQIPAHMGPRHGGRPLGTPGTLYESSAAHMRPPHQHQSMRRPGSGDYSSGGRGEYGRGEYAPSSQPGGRGDYGSGGRGGGGGGGGFRGGRGGSPSGYMHRGGRGGGGGYHEGRHQQHQQRSLGEFGVRHDSVMSLADTAGGGHEERGGGGMQQQQATMAVPVFGMIPPQTGPAGTGTDTAGTGAGMIHMLPPGAVVVTGDGTTAYVLPPQMVMAAAAPAAPVSTAASGGQPTASVASSPRTPSAVRHDGQGGHQLQQQPQAESSGAAPQLGIAIRSIPPTVQQQHQQPQPQQPPAKQGHMFPTMQVHMHQPQPRMHPAPPPAGIHTGRQQPPFSHPPYMVAHQQQAPPPSSSPPPIPTHFIESSSPSIDTDRHGGMLTIPSPPLPYSARNQLTPIGRMPGDMFPVELHKRLGDMQLLHMCCLRVLGVHPDASPDDLEVMLMACAVRPYDICVDPTTYKLGPPQPDPQQHQKHDQIMIAQVLSSDLAQDVFFKDTNSHLNQAMAMINGRKFMGRMLLVQRFPWIGAQMQQQQQQRPSPPLVDVGVGTSRAGGGAMMVVSGGARD